MVSRNIIIVILLLVNLALIGLMLNLNSRPETDAGAGLSTPSAPDSAADQGLTRQVRVLTADRLTNVINVTSPENALERFVLKETSRLLDEGGRPIEITDLMPGATIKALGKEAAPKVFLVDELRLLATPNIVLIAPQAGQAVGNPLLIKGTARVFENTLNYRLKDGAGEVLAEGSTQTEAPGIGRFGAFQAELSYAMPEVATGTLEVFQLSAKDGQEMDKIAVKVRLTTTVD